MAFVTRLLPAYEMSEHTHHMVWILTVVTLSIAIGGIILAFVMYSKRLRRSEKIERSLPYRILINQYYIPVLYEKVFAKPYAELSDIAWKEIDMQVVDATVDGIAHVVEETGDGTRKIQTGNLSDYLKWMAAGALLLAILAIVVAMNQ
jgi:NADH-quinone oxidoreductase subunit L